PRQAFQGVAQVDVRAVLVSGIKVGDSPVEGVAHELDKLCMAELELIRGMPDSVRAGAHTDQRSLDAGAAEHHLVCSALQFASSIGAGCQMSSQGQAPQSHCRLTQKTTP